MKPNGFTEKYRVVSVSTKHENMASKRTLVKQKVTYGSVGDENLHDSDDDLSGKRSITKRVSFESHELSDSDSDAENSLGRINRRTARARDSLDGLFRETSIKEGEDHAGLIKGILGESQSSTTKDKGEPKPVARSRSRPPISPRRTHFEASHSVATSQVSSDEDNVTSGKWPARAKEKSPVAPPRTSPRQLQEKSLSSDMYSSQGVPKTRPPLSSRKGEMKSFDGDHEYDEYKTGKVSKDDHEFRYDRSKNVAEKPMVPVRRKKTLEVDSEGDVEVYDTERKKNSSEEKPTAPSRRKMTLEETQESYVEKDNRDYDYQRTKNIPDKPITPQRRKKPFDETSEIQYSRPQIPMIKTSTFEDDSPYTENDRTAVDYDGNLRMPKKLNNGRPIVSRIRVDSSEEIEEEVDSGKVLYRKESYGSENYANDYDLIRGKAVENVTEQSAITAPKPSPRIRSKVKSSTSRQPQLAEEVKQAKRPGSAPAIKKASSLETLSSQQDSRRGSSGVQEQEAQKVQLKKSLTPQRPTSGKKISLLAQLRQKARADITDTFEEHVPSKENIFETGSGHGDFYSRRGDTVDSRAWETPKPQRSGPLKANHGIDMITRSQQRKEIQHTDHTKGGSRRGSDTPKRSSSMTNLRDTSPEPWGGDSARSSQYGELMDTASIRQAVFDEWQRRKSAKLKEHMVSRSSEKKKQEEKEKEERERKKLAKRAFESWNEMKQENSKEENAKKKEVMKKELEKQTEKNLKARDAKKYFESWKAKKDEELKEQHHKKTKEEREKKRKEEEEKTDKSKIAQKSFDNWKKNKDDKIKEESKKKRKEEKESTLKQEDENYERSIQSAERYQEWVEKKGKPRRGPPPPTLTQRSWCPSGRNSGNCIPGKVGAVIQAPAPNRSRTMSGSYYFKTNKF